MADNDLCIFGEVLYDSFPDGSRVLGGAPFNVAWHAQAFGLAPRFISRVGNDDDGDRVLAAMRGWGMSLDGMQQDSEHPTGLVRITLSDDNEPDYDIVPGSAWDFIDSAALATDDGCGLLYHGTLALRNPVSRSAAQTLRGQVGDRRMVDINLRSPWWDLEAVAAQLDGVSGIKLNVDELQLLVPGGKSLEERVRLFMDTWAPDMLIVTLGADGALATTRRGDTARVEPERGLSVVDTVGAGDAFTSVVLLGSIRGWPLQATLERAQRFASAIVGVRGATVSDTAFYRPFREDWGLA